MAEAPNDFVIPDEMVFDYEKSKDFRVIHVDGAHGGVQPGAPSIVMSVYSERMPIPRQEVYKQTDAGLVKIRDKTVKRPCDVLREVEASLVFSQTTARAIYEWLGKRLEESAKVEAYLADDRAKATGKKE